MLEWAEWYAALAVVSMAFSLSVTVHAVLYKRDIRSVIGWVGLAWLTPLIGSLAYLLLGINDLAEDSIEVLCDNFPDHPNIKAGCTFDSVYTVDGLQRSWINEATLGLFDPPEPPQFNYRPKS